MAHDTAVWNSLRELLMAQAPALMALPDAELARVPWEQLGTDSLGFIELVNTLETQYACRISNQELAAIHTLGALVALLAERRDQG